MAPPYSGEGVPENGASAFLHESLNNKDNFQLGKARKGYVAWYYLNTRRQHNVLELASEEELVFRVPIAWLQYNALWCGESAAADDPPTLLPQAFLTALRVPLAYRITSPVRLKDEDTRLMSNNDVRAVQRVRRGEPEQSQTLRPADTAAEAKRPTTTANQSLLSLEGCVRST